MLEFSMGQFVGILAAAANIGIAVMIILLLGERSHAAWTLVRIKAEEVTALRGTLESQAATGQAVLEQMRDDIAALKGQITRAQQDAEALAQRHKTADLPLAYTAVPVDAVDRRYRTWTVIVRNPDMGMDAGSFTHPAHRWIDGRLYEVPAATMDHAVEEMKARFPSREGYVVEPARSQTDREAIRQTAEAG